MLNVFRKSARLVLGLAAAVALSLGSPAAGAAGTGKVTGKVIGKDGGGVAGANVRLVVPAPRDAAGAAPAADAPGGGGAKARGKQTVVAKTTSEADGSFTLAEVPAGDYVLNARTKDKLAARQKVSVRAGETASVELRLREPRQPGAGGKRKAKAAALAN